jgi:hypothetical protein
MAKASEAEGRRWPGGEVGRAVAQFAASGLLALILLGAAGVYLLRETGRGEAIRNAKQVTALAAHSLVEPNLSPGLLRGDPAAIRRLDRVVRGSVVDGRTVRVKIWRDDGRILYSDQHRLIGSRYPLGADELATIRQGKVAAGLSDLTRPENRFERRYQKLLEVYLPIRGPGGQW